MLASRLSPLALSAACIALGALPAQSPAAEPATVTVRVEGLAQTRLPSTAVTTTTTPVVGDGNPAHACPGTSALGALQLATGGNWSGPWNEEFKQYEIYGVEGETHVFESGAPANYFWSLWVNDVESEVGACAAELHPGDRVLLFPSCYGSACPATAATPLEIQAPPTAAVGEPVTVTVSRYDRTGQGSPIAGATVEGGASPATTDAAGQATVSFSGPGTATLNAEAPSSIRTEASVCVHAGNDGTCGTTAPGAAAAPQGGLGVAGFASPYKGPFALVAALSGIAEGHVYARGHGPRLLSGTIHAHSAVTAVSLELRRRSHGRCYAYDGTSERFRRARCGSGTPFKVSSDGSFSYLLPSALPAGRYVLDVLATDAAGNRTTLARGTSRIVFHVS